MVLAECLQRSMWESLAKDCRVREVCSLAVHSRAACTQARHLNKTSPEQRMLCTRPRSNIGSRSNGLPMHAHRAARCRRSERQHLDQIRKGRSALLSHAEGFCSGCTARCQMAMVSRGCTARSMTRTAALPRVAGEVIAQLSRAPDPRAVAGAPPAAPQAAAAVRQALAGP